MKKGIFFSLDAILALLIAFSLAAAILNALSALPAFSNSNSNLRISEDALSSMEKSGVFEKALRDSSAVPIQEFVRSLPNNICYRIAISKPPAANAIIAEENCKCNTFSVTYRSFLVADASAEEYTVQMRTCYK